MKYAAKRTWPEKSAAWEHEGEAESMPSFAAEFASVERLGLDVEFVVMEREGEAGEIQFFRVSSTAPCQVVVAEPKAADTPVAALPEHNEAAANRMPAPDLSPVMSMLFFMGKVSAVAILGVGTLGYLMVKVIGPALR